MGEMIIWLVFLAIIGAAFGSFVGALTWRLKRGGKLWREFWRGGHSQCEHCGHQLSAKDLLPIVSWMALRGKCRYCGKKIGISSLLIEIGLAAAFVVSFLLWPVSFGELLPLSDWSVLLLFILWLVMIVFMAALLVFDARWRRLPNVLLWPLVGLAAVFATVNGLIIQEQTITELIIQILLAAIPITGVYGALWLISGGRLIGLGDVKFGLVVALTTTVWGAVAVLFGANLLGSLAMLPLLLQKKLHRQSKIAFGPWLIIATFFIVLLTEPIMRLTERYLLL